ncbi:superoxide dismutase [Amycolatopsis jejuensis]|uniref:superoxide dismutase n=1 Tax=Amycolatopsis jejuensis TaxID=330084 RepID=UPI000525450B|nr:superoxide dismutase [Amycolatopsis jejuensis]
MSVTTLSTTATAAPASPASGAAAPAALASGTTTHGTTARAALTRTAASVTPPLRVTSAHGTFSAYAPDVQAVTYRPDLVAAGARARVAALSADRVGTTTVLVISGLLPQHEYGAHAHVNSCGATGDAAGSHFQHVPDPVKPSVDPAYANPRNEIWLDFTTDRFGIGHATSTVDWTFGGQRAKSVVIHETHTHTGPGHAGTAGGRLACLNVGF